MKRKDIPKEILEEAEWLAKELTRISKDPEVLERAEEFQRKISTLTVEELFREFTI